MTDRAVAPRPRRIVVHDFAGHPGQAQLSRALARRGHVVVHQHCPSYTTGRGALSPAPRDPQSLRFEPCPMDGTFERYSPARRLCQETAYGLEAGRRIAAADPDVAIVSNVPLVALAVASRTLARRGVPTVLWQQDVYSAAITDAAVRRLSHAGRLVGWSATRMERSVARSSQAVVPIATTFLETLSAWGVREKSTVIGNWGPVGEIAVCDKHNPFSEAMGLADVPVVMYSGTLGFKHDPSALADIATTLRTACPEARLVVISEGQGRDWLEQWKREHAADNLTLLDYQPYSELGYVLGSADVLLAVLEPGASRFSVPSKVLTYLCAQRAIVAVVPADNTVAEILRASRAGIVVDPQDRRSLCEQVVRLLDDETLRDRLGAAGRRYAELHFSVDDVATQFESIVEGCLGAPRTRQALDAPFAP